MDLSHLLQHLAHSLGLDSLALNENGVLSLQFDETIVVHLEPENEEAHLYSPLCRVPEEKEARIAFFEALLTANSFGRGTAGAAFGIDDGSREIVLGRQFKIATTEPGQLLDWLRDMVSVMDVWRKRLPDLVGDTVLPSAEQPEENFHFLRV